MPIGSLQFLALVLLLSAAFFAIPSIFYRRLVFFTVSVSFIGALLPNVDSGLLLLIFLGSGYLVGRRLQEFPSRLLLGAYLIGLVGGYAVIQKYSIGLSQLAALLSERQIYLVGISYMLFRQIHFLVDSNQQQIKGSTFYEYLNYQLNFFALVAGPIQRFQEFSRFWNTVTPILKSKNEILRAYFRVFYGVICVVGVSGLLGDWHASLYQDLSKITPDLAQSARAETIMKVLAVIYLYPVFMYFNFAGYCDIVIGAAALIGLKLPENFDRPYLARNVLDFWTRWHQSLGFWVRDYLFTPMYMALAKWNSKSAGSLAFVCYFVAFVVMGVWHGTGLGFLIFGLMQGIGGSAAKLWEMFLINKRGRKGLRDYMKMRWVRVLGIAMTLNYFAISLLFFSPGLDKALVPWRAVCYVLLGS